MRLDDDMRRVVAEQSLGFVATVCPDGTPNLSPKGTTVVWDDEHLAFLHLCSPGTVANLTTNPTVEVNVVDPIVRTGYRFKGVAEVLTGGERYEAVLDHFRRERGSDTSRVQAVVLVRVDHAAALVSPAYDAGATEEAVVTRWRSHHLQLAEPAPPSSSIHQPSHARSGRGRGPVAVNTQTCASSWKRNTFTSRWFAATSNLWSRYFTPSEATFTVSK